MRIGIGIGLGLNGMGGAASAYAAYALAFDPKGGEYWVSGTKVTERELIGDTDFDGNGWWVLDAGITISGGKLNFGGVSGSAYKLGQTVIGQAYLVTFTIDSISAGRVMFTGGTPRTAPGTYTETLVATSTNLGLGTGGQVTTAVVDNASFKAVGVAALPGYTFTRTGGIRQENDGTATYLGAEKFAGLQAAGWSAPAGTAIVDADDYTTSTTTGPLWSNVFTVGSTYEITYNITSTNSGTVRFQNQSAAGAGTILAQTAAGGSSGTFRLTATDPGLFLRSGLASTVATTLISLSVKEVLNDAFDSFGTNEPAIVPGIGYWSRGALTNIALHSQAFDNAAWAKGGSTLVANDQTSPEGTASGDTLTSTAINSSVNQGITLTAGVAHTASVFVKKGTSAFVSLRMFGFDHAAGTEAAWFNLNTGTVGTRQSAVSAAYMIDYGGGWYRCVIVFSTTTDLAGFFYVYQSDADVSYNSTVGNTISLWQGQVLAGNLPDGGPVIKTDAAAVAVGADDIKLGAPMADEDWLIWAKGNYRGATNGDYQLLATFDNGTTGQMIFLGRNPNGSAGVGVVATSNVLSATTTGLGMPMNGAGEAIVGLMRRGGKYTVISRYGGSTTFKAESAALAMPTGIANLRAGKHFNALYYADAPVEFIGHRIGTFTNEAAAVAIGTPYNGTAVGDSTVADYLGNNNLLFYVDTSLEKKNLAVPGNNISQQDTAFANSGAAITAKWVIIQVGLNDLDPAESTTAAKIALLQNLVDDARAKAPATSKIFISKMVPCRARLITLYGGTNGPIAYQRWLDMNEAIAGGGATPITNVDGRITAHEPLMNDGAGNLKAEYDTGDGIHPNNAGRAVNGQAWEDALNAAGVLG